MKKIFLQILSLVTILLIIFSLNSCKNCDDYACFTPPQIYNLLLLDSANGNDLLYNGTFEQRFVKVFDSENHIVETNFFVDSINQRTIINSSAFWNTDANNSCYNIKIQTDTGDIVIPFVILQIEKYEDCCTFFELEQFKINKYRWKIVDYCFCEIYLNQPL
jgi:hypothetical protein